MDKKSFKIVYGFKPNEFIAITKAELPKAYYAFKQEVKMITDDGVAIRGRDIMRIEPYWNDIMGYNEDYVLLIEDFQEIGIKRKEHSMALMIEAKNISELAIENKNPELLNEPVVVKKLEEPISKELSDKFRI